ncbi:hypothetical protein HMPREF9406_1160 [Clostridium sp. HGF2]|nr:hypothetical protein HMPREF9406_1160 [Clostridium sp. HGF2]EQJ52267.1 hypothetical protein QSI_3888 [Clostridioides difficile P28]
MFRFEWKSGDEKQQRFFSRKVHKQTEFCYNFRNKGNR